MGMSVIASHREMRKAGLGVAVHCIGVNLYPRPANSADAGLAGRPERHAS